MRTGAASRRSTAVPPARIAPTRSDGAEAGTLPRAPLTSVAATLMAAGGVTDGANVSTTITLNDAVRVLPCASLAVQVQVVAPSANVDPLAGAQLGVTGPSSVSAADAAYVNGAPVGPVSSTVAIGGTVSTGAVVSVTVTVNVFVATFARASLAVQDTVVVPDGKNDPLAGVQVATTVPSTTSAADAVYVNTAPAGLVASTDACAGTVIAGAVLSRTVTNVADTDDNCPSLTVNVSRCEPIGNIAVTVAAFPIPVARSVHRKDRVSPSRSVPP